MRKVRPIVGTAALGCPRHSSRMVKMLTWNPSSPNHYCWTLLMCSESNYSICISTCHSTVRKRMMMLMMLPQKTVTCQRSACSLLHVQKDFESGDEALEDNMHADWQLSILSRMPDVWHPIVQHLKFFVWGKLIDLSCKDGWSHDAWSKCSWTKSD